MKMYTVGLLQLILWSGYSVIEWLSKHDLFVYKILMFGVFLYLAVILGQYIIQSARKTAIVTSISLGIYGSVQLILSMIWII